ncbi:hypothetical protein P7C73_g6779, partial [Tremellales sp. Uapishka_1]
MSKALKTLLRPVALTLPANPSPPSTARPIPKLPFFRDPAHTIPTKWSLYRPLLRHARALYAPAIEAKLRLVWRKRKAWTSIPQTRAWLSEQYESLALLESALGGDVSASSSIQTQNTRLEASFARAKERHEFLVNKARCHPPKPPFSLSLADVDNDVAAAQGPHDRRLPPPDTLQRPLTAPETPASRTEHDDPQPPPRARAPSSGPNTVGRVGASHEARKPFLAQRRRARTVVRRMGLPQQGASGDDRRRVRAGYSTIKEGLWDCDAGPDRKGAAGESGPLAAQGGAEETSDWRGY